MLGKLYLYSRYRKARREREALEEELRAGDEICRHCGYRRSKHSDDDAELCPSYDATDI